MALLGPELHDLTLDDVRRFLDGADSEPLLWEAKGTDMHKAGIRKAVCGFANGRQPAYLILGADKVAGTWQLNGVDLAGDPPAWVSSVIQDGLDPVPLIDVRSLPVPGTRDLHVAVVEVPPVAIPPCISKARSGNACRAEPSRSKSPRACPSCTRAARSPRMAR